MMTYQKRGSHFFPTEPLHWKIKFQFAIIATKYMTGSANGHSFSTGILRTINNLRTTPEAEIRNSAYGFPPDPRKTQPCLTLKRGFFLLMTYTRPLRRTTRQSLSRIFADFREFLTFIIPALQYRHQTIYVQRKYTCTPTRREVRRHISICQRVKHLNKGI